MGKRVDQGRFDFRRDQHLCGQNVDRGRFGLSRVI
jgi:hypothetical protein